MDYQSIARPIKRWAIKHHGKALKFDERDFYLEFNELGKLNEKEGGMGIAYRCHYIENGIEHKCWIKHTKIDEATESQIRTRLHSGNREIINEANIQKKVNSIGFGTEVIYSDKFAVNDGEPEFEIIIQREAKGESFYDLKDLLDHSERGDLLKLFFKALLTLHEHNIYHSDLDLNHIYFDKENNKITLIDWGGATLNEERLDVGISTTKGKPVFSPPEQRKKEDREYYFPQSEVFSACAVAYYFLEDKKNGLHDSPEYADNKNYESYQLGANIEVSPSIISAIKRATKNNPHERFASISELLFSWNNTSSELPSLIVKTTDFSGVVNEMNSKLSHDDLNFNFIQDNLYPSWQVDGDFEVFQTAGSMRGMWRDQKQVLVVDKPMIIKSKTGGDYVLLTVDNHNITNTEEDVEIDSSGEMEMVQDKESGEIFELLSESEDNVTLVNVTDQEKYNFTKAEFNSRFDKL